MPDYTIYIVICLIVLLILGGVIIFFRQRKNKIPKEIPAEVLKEFERAEELQSKYKGSVTPQAIIWQVNEERGKIFTLEEGEYEDKVKESIQEPQPKPKLNLGGLFRRRQ